MRRARINATCLAFNATGIAFQRDVRRIQRDGHRHLTKPASHSMRRASPSTKPASHSTRRASPSNETCVAFNATGIASSSALVATSGDLQGVRLDANFPLVRILGINPGSRVAGFGVVEGASGHCRSVVSGVVKLGDGPLSERLLTLHVALSSIIEEHEPGAVAIEGVFSRVSPRSALILGHARGVAVLCAAQAELPVFEYAPATIERSLTQGGGATKHSVARAVGMVLGLRVALAADAADALAVAICHHSRARLQMGPRAGTPSAWVRALAGAPRARQSAANLLLAASLKGR